MAESENDAEEAPAKTSRLPLILGLVLMLALGAGGFYAVYAGLVFGHAESHAGDMPEVEALPEIAFVPIEPLVISLGAQSPGRYLHFSAQIEVAKVSEPDVVLILPRVVDVLNGYLRAVEVSDLEDPTALVRLRAQMLRRVQMVAGEGRVRDLLVTGFVIN